MRWIVCIKQVPDTTEIRIDSRTNNLVREGIASIMNPYDCHALEAALQLRDQHGGQVTVVTMGPSQAEECLRDALAMGADEAVLLSDPAFRGADTLATSYTLAAAIRRLAPVQLIFCGKQAIDGDTAQVGPELAEWLGLPHIAGVEYLVVKANNITARREAESEYYLVEANLPALVTISRTMNEPRLPSVWGRLRANRTPITVWTGEDLDIDPNRIGLAGSPTRVKRIFYPQHQRQTQIRQGNAEQLSNWLVKTLAEERLL
ncbi:MAG: electron transfer flavoprotein subunit beta/FixA family protein [Syntrophomonadaceae bacterium]|jgi:electron transfer flavoprotein alpha/beta subunit|nr:electron transfer flavoprotein subunit beta/FixA family protein [Syntrophomonadaceae bacterium]